MKKPLYAGGFYRAGALSVVCAMLASCALLDAIDPYTQQKQQVQNNISTWQTAGSPAMVSCRDPFEINTPAPSGSMAPQAYSSMRDFSSAAMAAQAPIQECAVIGGSDDAAQIAKAGWGTLGYAPLHVWRPATAFIEWEWGSKVLLHPLPGQGGNFGDDYTYETSTFSERISAAYGAWYLAYQRNPQDDAQARRQGTGLYAMQGFRCAIHMRDFPAARRYWALALSSNPGSTSTYAQLALQSFFQVLFPRFRNDKNDGGSDYLNIPQDIRSAVWDAAGQRYSVRDATFTMARAEKAARTGRLNKILSRKIPTLSILHCPVFYPELDPIAITPASDLDLEIPAYQLISATERATGKVRAPGKGR